jgi:hypothetical protein
MVIVSNRVILFPRQQYHNSDVITNNTVLFYETKPALNLRFSDGCHYRCREVSHHYENDNDNEHVITLWIRVSKSCHLAPFRSDSSCRSNEETNAKGGADAQLGEKQWMWRHIRPEIATTSFQCVIHKAWRFPLLCSCVDVAVYFNCVSASAAYLISSSGSSLTNMILLICFDLFEKELATGSLSLSYSYWSVRCYVMAISVCYPVYSPGSSHSKKK